jgi:hypothetical protein
MAIFSLTEHAAVRAAIDVSLDEDTLPDDVITLEIFADAAEADLLQRDPVAATRPASEQPRVRRALVYYTAARIAPALPGYTSETLGAYKYSRPEWDGAKRAAELKALAERELAVLLESGGYPLATTFARASGTRGW